MPVRLGSLQASRRSPAVPAVATAGRCRRRGEEAAKRVVPVPGPVGALWLNGWSRGGNGCLYRRATPRRAIRDRGGRYGTAAARSAEKRSQGALAPGPGRSEERRVGKEGRSRG